MAQDALGGEHGLLVSLAAIGLNTEPLYQRNVVDQSTEVEWSGEDLRVTGPRVATYSTRSGEAIPEVHGNTDLCFPLDSVSISVRGS